MGDTLEVSADGLGKILLEMGITMLHAGAPSRRVNLVLVRISNAYGFDSYQNISTRHLSISIQDAQGKTFSGARSKTSLPGVNFRVVSDISNLSLELAENPLPLKEVKEKLQVIKKKPHFPRLVILTAVSLAGASFCYLFGGDWTEMILAFGATFLGLFLKQELIRKSVNIYITTYLSSFLAAFVIALVWRFGFSIQVNQALATGVLFLVPGVPLVISFVDLLDGYILNGIDRGVNALMHAFGIAAGLASVLYLFEIPL